MKKKILILALLLPVFLLSLSIFGCEEEQRLDVSAEPEEGGSVEGAGSYEQRKEVEVKAVPAEGYVFAGWQKEGEIVGTEDVYRFTIERDISLVALFEEELEYVTVDLFFGCSEAIHTGDTGEYGYVTPYSIEISEPEDPETLLRVALKELIKGPPPEEEAYSAVVYETLEVLAVKIDEEKVAEIAVSEEMFGEQWPGGSLPGTVFMQSVVLTATQFPEVDAVIVTVEGELWDDSHRIWEAPVGPQDVI